MTIRRRRFLLIGVLAALAPGCERGVTYRLDARVIDRETGKPVVGEAIVAQHYGKRDVLDSNFDVDPAELTWKTAQKGTTDSEGKFGASFETIVGGVGSVPPPSFLIQIGEDSCKELLKVRTETPSREVRPSSVRVQRYNPVTGEMLPPEKEGTWAKVAPSHGEEPEKGEFPAHLDLIWDEKTACEETKEAEKRGGLVGPGKNLVFASYSDLFTGSLGLGYARSLLAEDFLRIEIPFGLSSGATALGILIKMRYLPIWRFNLTLFGGGEGISVHSSPPSSTYQASDSGVHGTLGLSVDYRTRTGLYAEAGFASLGLDSDRRDSRGYLRLGWTF